jgi:hypothetical protein
MYVYTYTCVEFDPKRTVFSHYLVFYLSLSLISGCPLPRLSECDEKDAVIGSACNYPQAVAIPLPQAPSIINK